MNIENELLKNQTKYTSETLRSISFGYRQIISLDGVEALVRLKNLTLVGNKISNIRSLGTLKFLQKLELGRNLIRVLEPLQHCENLERLQLNHNKITDLSQL